MQSDKKRGLLPTLPVPKAPKIRVLPPIPPPIKRPCQMCDQKGKLYNGDCWGCQGKGYYLTRNHYAPE